MFTFQLSNFLACYTALHAWNGLSAGCWDWRVTVNAKNASYTWLSGAGVLNMTLQVFFDTLLYEIHGISHQCQSPRDSAS
ncbi:UNVERIFIED_ORG: hypothetical protein M2154_000068 [Enterobacter sp. JUb101]|nr:hypothetical protein [Lelliottia amnigena]